MPFNTAQKLADIVAEHKVEWLKNLAAVKARDEVPRENRAVTERFAHFTASQRMLIAYLGDQEGSRDRGTDNSAACRKADQLIEGSFAWQQYQKTLNA